MPGNNFNFGVTLTAADRTQSGVQSALGRFAGLKKVLSAPITGSFKIAGAGLAGLGVLRDIHLGLRPALQAMDGLVQRGGSLSATLQSFQSLTGRSGQSAMRMARELVQASSGTLKLVDAMQVANRGLSAGMDLDQIATAIEFIGKKAASTGVDADQAIKTVITGLSRGSTLFLDDFGILVDGVEGVKRAYEGIRGAGAWDSIGPAAQKAETVRQAIAEMRQQMDRIGVSGKEVLFTWATLKSSIGDAVDSISSFLLASKQVQGVLARTSELASGLSKFLQSGGSFGEALWAGIRAIGGGLVDLGESIGRSMAAGLLKAFLAGAPTIASALGISEQGILKIEAGIGFERWSKAVEDAKRLFNYSDALAKPRGAGTAAGGPANPRQAADLARQERVIRGDTNFEIRRMAAAQADAELRQRKITPADRQKRIAEIVAAEKERRLQALREPARDPVARAMEGFQGNDRDGLILDGGGGAAPAAAGLVNLPRLGTPTSQPASTSSARRGRAPLTRAEREAQRRRIARMNIETLPEEIADDIRRLEASSSVGIGRAMTKQDRSFFVRKIIANVGALERSARDSGMEGHGFNLDRFRLKNGDSLGRLLNRFDRYAWDELGINDPFGPDHPIRRINPVGDRVRSLRNASRRRAMDATGRMRDRAEGRLGGLLDRQSWLTELGRRDVDRGVNELRSIPTGENREATLQGVKALIEDAELGDERRRRAHERIGRGIGRFGEANRMEPSIQKAEDAIEKIDKVREEISGLRADVGKMLGSLVAGIVGGERDLARA